MFSEAWNEEASGLVGRTIDTGVGGWESAKCAPHHGWPLGATEELEQESAEPGLHWLQQGAA